MLTGDWNTLMPNFMDKYGEENDHSGLPSQSNFEAFEEKLADGDLFAETLTQNISLAQKKPNKEPAMNGQMDLNFDSTLTQVVHVNDAHHHRGLEGKYKVMTQMWLSAQMRQPGRPFCADLTEHFHQVLRRIAQFKKQNFWSARWQE